MRKIIPIFILAFLLTSCSFFNNEFEPAPPQDSSTSDLTQNTAPDADPDIDVDTDSDIDTDIDADNDTDND